MALTRKSSMLLLLLMVVLVTLTKVAGQPEAADETSDTASISMVGIDLGARYTRVAVIRNGTTKQVEIIPNEDGALATPTYVTWDPLTGELIVGERAKQQAVLNPHNTVFDFKRILGCTYDSEEVQAAIDQLPYAIVERDNKPIIQVQVGPSGGWQEFTPEEITAIVLAKMKQSAEQYLGHEVLDAVVTVPAYFNDAQRQAMKDAGTIAGVTVQRVINEPTAAAIAHKIDKTAQGERFVLVVNMGGGTLDVTVICVDGGVFEVLATDRKIVSIGGDSFDDRIMQHCITKWKNENNVDISTNLTGLQKLRREAERVKRALSTESEAEVHIEWLDSSGDTRYLTEVILRRDYDSLTEDLVEPILTVVDEVLSDGDVKMAEVDDIVLVGGSTRMPKVREMVSAHFDGKELSLIADAEEAVVHGAAMQAWVLSGDPDDVPICTAFMSLTYLSLGVETAGGVMHRVVPRNSFYPTTRRQMVTTLHANQAAAHIRVYEGERTFTRDNRLIGQLHLRDLSPVTKGNPQIEIIFDVDVNNENLVVSAREISSGAWTNASITLDQNKLALEALEYQVREAAAAEESDVMAKERIIRWLGGDGASETDVEALELEQFRRELSESEDAILVILQERAPAHDEV